MNKPTRIASLALTAGILSAGALVPANSAEAAPRYGTVTVKEGRKAVREADSQRCLTYKELRKLVGGKANVKSHKGTKILTWPGKGKALGLYAVTRNGCAVHVSLDYSNGAALEWWK